MKKGDVPKVLSLESLRSRLDKAHDSLSDAAARVAYGDVAEDAIAALEASERRNAAVVKWMNKAMCWLAMQASDAVAFRAEGDELIAALRGDPNGF